jgi:DNA transposition AAA+ family ATPase
MPPSFMLGGRVDRLFALQLRGLEDTVSLIVTLEANSLLLVSFEVLRIQSSSDGVEINLANV